MVSAVEKTLSSRWMRLGVGRLLTSSGKRKPLWAPGLTFSDKQVLCWRGTGKAFLREGQRPCVDLRVAELKSFRRPADWAVVSSTNENWKAEEPSGQDRQMGQSWSPISIRIRIKHFLKPRSYCSQNSHNFTMSLKDAHKRYRCTDGYTEEVCGLTLTKTAPWVSPRDPTQTFQEDALLTKFCGNS